MGLPGLVNPPIGTKKSKASHFGLSWTKGMKKHGKEFYPPLN